jgi:ribosomal-protein-alanine N-acetyltransferase
MIIIRAAHEDDISRLALIGLRAWEKATSDIGMTDTLRENARMAFANFTHSSWLSIRVAEFDGAVVGWTARENFDDTITDFWVDPQFERQGVGRALLDDIEDQLRLQNYDVAKLESHAQNQVAINFFCKHGYSISWLSVTYSPKLDRDVQSLGLSKNLEPDIAVTYGGI